ncbi:MAG: 30S ribosomal protein S9 [Chlamydiae bacterium RIFCSPHIGHO2_12_FULL_49_11]|nr:MAG: 30S ribosomal protein S9 [Chlamydiae bacterium RIFCSPHIGHO2_12_FULL_49_11]
MLKKKLDESIRGTGRRKTAVARVKMSAGTGQCQVNGKKLADYFPVALLQAQVKAPLQLCGLEDRDLLINVSGGGLEGQAIAVRLGLSRALVKENGERRKLLKDEGFLTRDPRKKERKKYGKKKARKSFQFSKR